MVSTIALSCSTTWPPRTGHGCSANACFLEWFDDSSIVSNFEFSSLVRLRHIATVASADRCLVIMLCVKWQLFGFQVSAHMCDTKSTSPAQYVCMVPIVGFSMLDAGDHATFDVIAMPFLGESLRSTGMFLMNPC